MAEEDPTYRPHQPCAIPRLRSLHRHRPDMLCCARRGNVMSQHGETTTRPATRLCGGSHWLDRREQLGSILGWFCGPHERNERSAEIAKMTLSRGPPPRLSCIWAMLEVIAPLKRSFDGAKIQASRCYVWRLQWVFRRLSRYANWYDKIPKSDP